MPLFSPVRHVLAWPLTVRCQVGSFSPLQQRQPPPPGRSGHLPFLFSFPTALAGYQPQSVCPNSVPGPSPMAAPTGVLVLPLLPFASRLCGDWAAPHWPGGLCTALPRIPQSERLRSLCLLHSPDFVRLLTPKFRGNSVDAPLAPTSVSHPLSILLPPIFTRQHRGWPCFYFSYIISSFLTSLFSCRRTCELGPPSLPSLYLGSRKRNLTGLHTPQCRLAGPLSCQSPALEAEVRGPLRMICSMWQDFKGRMYWFNICDDTHLFVFIYVFTYLSFQSEGSNTSQLKLLLFL